MSRLLVQSSIADSFIEKVKARFASAGELTGFDPSVPTTAYGPMADITHFNRVMSFIEVGKQSSAELLYGGSQKGGKGLFIEPTVFLNPSADNPILTEEIFGPVLVVNTFDTVEEAIVLANNSVTGLAGKKQSVFSLH
jgi:aldehyde dehydrogenase (NAD+)